MPDAVMNNASKNGTGRARRTPGRRGAANRSAVADEQPRGESSGQPIVRDAAAADAESIHRLIDKDEGEGHLLPRDARGRDRARRTVSGDEAARPDLGGLRAAAREGRCLGHLVLEGLAVGAIALDLGQDLPAPLVER